MSLGKPIVVSNAIPLRRIVQDERCGLVFDMDSPASLVDAVVHLGKNGTDRARMADNARKAVERRYNWSRDSAALCKTIDNIGSAGPAACGKRKIYEM